MARQDTLRIPADVNKLARVRHFVEATGRRWRADARRLQDVVLAVDEAASNIIIHGYGQGPGTVEIHMEQAADALVVRLRDRARPFDPTGVPPPDLSAPLEQRPIGGLGLHLVRSVMDEVVYQPRAGGGNELTLVKRAVFDANAV